LGKSEKKKKKGVKKRANQKILKAFGKQWGKNEKTADQKGTKKVERGVAHKKEGEPHKKTEQFSTRIRRTQKKNANINLKLRTVDRKKNQLRWPWRRRPRKPRLQRDRTEPKGDSNSVEKKNKQVTIHQKGPRRTIQKSCQNRPSAKE